MSSNLAAVPEPEPLRAVTVSRDVQEFDLLIEDMEAELGEGWGDLDFAEALAFLHQDEARELEFIVVAVDHEDEPRLSTVIDVIRQAKNARLRVI
ncbi:MAG: pilus assembly protein CpaE, partial [Pseudomonadota bacterium]